MTDDKSRLPRTVLWRRIDVEGLDACHYGRSESGYEISGTAIYLEGNEPANFTYRISCSTDWSSNSAWVTGRLGATEKNIKLSRDAGGEWAFNDESVAGLDGLLDIDLGFSPATNTNAINRLGLSIGEEVETTAVWLDTADWRIIPLRQVYRRLSSTEFVYRSPSHDYSAKLTTDDFGIVREYPGLWTAVSQRGSYAG
ncbi:putative glycolipid-binding domain-containing protein [Cognatiyoonia sp. IB215182]|uniref:putative glycolipid-binding domain-containing protein n=1 Tax=Cognatiyoonia sp. IB215182 TaxID=3097353 RepID=UPI002A13322D|nr:putative glycolipid-binding domain-containing protein [Cognatiyoonia sp. IB215182]MDX8352368.1 putative glycolipid-binding domain-containing protein [Cognatiyoonia sp. IB215182]